MPEPSTNTPTLTQILLATHTRTKEIKTDTKEILSLLSEPKTEGEQDRIDQILQALTEILTSLSTIHARLEKVTPIT
jgi:hypothetical protein